MSLSLTMNSKTIKVSRIIGMEEEAEFTVDQPMTDEEVFSYLANCGDKLQWEETEVITHYKVVENYA